MQGLGLPVFVSSLLSLLFVPSLVWASGEIFQAIQNGTPAQVEALLSGGIDVDVWDDNGLTPLMVAAFLGHADIVAAPARGSNVNARDLQGETALIKASAAGREEVVRLLLEKGRT